MFTNDYYVDNSYELSRVIQRARVCLEEIIQICKEYPEDNFPPRQIIEMAQGVLEVLGEKR